METYRAGLRREVVQALPEGANEAHVAARQRQAIARHIHSLQAALMQPGSHSRLLVTAAEFFLPAHFDDVVMERSFLNRCGYPACDKPLPEERLRATIKEQVDTARLAKEKSDPLLHRESAQLKHYCSRWCQRCSLFVASQLSPVAPFARLTDGRSYAVQLPPNTRPNAADSQPSGVTSSPTESEHVRAEEPAASVTDALSRLAVVEHAPTDAANAAAAMTAAFNAAAVDGYVAQRPTEEVGAAAQSGSSAAVSSPSAARGFRKGRRTGTSALPDSASLAAAPGHLPSTGVTMHAQDVAVPAERTATSSSSSLGGGIDDSTASAKPAAALVPAHLAGNKGEEEEELFDLAELRRQRISNKSKRTGRWGARVESGTGSTAVEEPLDGTDASTSTAARQHADNHDDASSDSDGAEDDDVDGTSMFLRDATSFLTSVGSARAQRKIAAAHRVPGSGAAGPFTAQGQSTVVSRAMTTTPVIRVPSGSSADASDPASAAASALLSAAEAPATAAAAAPQPAEAPTAVSAAVPAMSRKHVRWEPAAMPAGGAGMAETAQSSVAASTAEGSSQLALARSAAPLKRRTHPQRTRWDTSDDSDEDEYDGFSDEDEAAEGSDVGDGNGDEDAEMQYWTTHFAGGPDAYKEWAEDDGELEETVGGIWLHQRIDQGPTQQVDGNEGAASAVVPAAATQHTQQTASRKAELLGFGSIEAVAVGYDQPGGEASTAQVGSAVEPQSADSEGSDEEEDATHTASGRSSLPSSSSSKPAITAGLSPTTASLTKLRIFGMSTFGILLAAIHAWRTDDTAAFFRRQALPPDPLTLPTTGTLAASDPVAAAYTEAAAEVQRQAVVLGLARRDLMLGHLGRQAAWVRDTLPSTHPLWNELLDSAAAPDNETRLAMLVRTLSMREPVPMLKPAEWQWLLLVLMLTLKSTGADDYPLSSDSSTTAAQAASAQAAYLAAYLCEEPAVIAAVKCAASAVASAAQPKRGKKGSNLPADDNSSAILTVFEVSSLAHALVHGPDVPLPPVRTTRTGGAGAGAGAGGSAAATSHASLSARTPAMTANDREYNALVQAEREMVAAANYLSSRGMAVPQPPPAPPGRR